MPNLNIQKTLALFLAAIFVFSCITDSASAARTVNEGTEETFEPPRRQGKDQAKSLEETSRDIDAKLDVVLKIVISGGSLKEEDIRVAKDFLKNAKASLTRLDKEIQAKYYMLSSWLSYYSGDYKMAFRDAIAAQKAWPDEPDTKTTLLTMSLLNREYRTAMLLIPQQQTGSSIFGTTGKSRTSGTQSTSGRYQPKNALNFDIGNMRADLLSQEMPAMESACINKSTFSFARKAVLGVLFWKQAWDNGSSEKSFAATPANEEQLEGSYSATSGSESASAGLKAFADIFAAYLDNPKAKFVGINVDQPADQKKAIGLILQNPWPWAQVIADGQSENALAKFIGLKLRSPVFAIVDGDGRICYAGPPDSAVGRIVLANAVASFKVKPESPPQPASATTAQPKPDAEGTGTEASQKSTEQETAEQDQSNPQAENLYQTALVYRKTAKVLGYKRMVEYCRNILQNYPDTPQAEKAKELLKEIPENERAAYNITNEELGL